jgi:hypothetical protein
MRHTVTAAQGERGARLGAFQVEYCPLAHLP